MQRFVETVLPVIVAVIASGGFWSYLAAKRSKRDRRLDTCVLHTRVLVGLGHDRIIYLGLCYIKRGWITQAEYENLLDYLYAPYLELGGNGTAMKIIEEVKKLPIQPIMLVHVPENQPAPISYPNSTKECT